MKNVAETGREIKENISKLIVGKEETIDLLLVGLLAKGHVLLEDVPGVGKTMLARGLAASIAGEFYRIQFTPDLLPSDITGINFYNQKEGQFEFREGPLFGNIVLADEINRATPRTQSALLEAMQEGQVSVDGVTRGLPKPFLVMATQNPVEMSGTFPLPEAQLDRFLLRLPMGYPTLEEEMEITRRFQKADPLSSFEAVVSVEDIAELQKLVKEVEVSEDVREYLANVVRKTREHQAVELGASPRASLALMSSAQALAALQGRDFVTPDDIKYLAEYVLAHRLVLGAKARLEGGTAAEIINDIVGEIPVPVE